MNLNELFLCSITTDQQASAPMKSNGRTSFSISQGLTFGQVLDNRMSNVSAKTGQRGVSGVSDRNGRSAVIHTGHESKHESYRRLVDSGNGSEKAGTADRIKSKVVSEEKDQADENGIQKSKSDTGNSSRVMLEILAQMLGVDSMKLDRILAENGINTDDLSGNIEEAAAVLSEAFSLDDGQNSTLIKLMQLINDTVLSGTGDPNQAVPCNDPVRADGTNVSDITYTLITADDDITEELRDYIAGKIDEISVRLSTEEDSVTDMVRQAFLSMQKRTGSLKQNIINADLAEVYDGEDDETSAADNVISQKEREISAGSEKSSVSIMHEDNNQSSILQPESSSNDVRQMAAFNIISNNVNDNPAGISAGKTDTQPVQTREIIGQIVEKAAVMLSDDKNEMVMELKPESLGRISLKVVTENGIVMAKFVAENRQVQHVLETNMQQLRDALARQGINVQSLSVSVRHDGGQEGDYKPQYSSWGQMKEGKRSYSTKLNSISGIIEGISGELTGRNPYLWDDSTINITA